MTTERQWFVDAVRRERGLLDAFDPDYRPRLPSAFLLRKRETAKALGFRSVWEYEEYIHVCARKSGWL